VVLAGPVANFVLAIAIFTAFFAIIGGPVTSVVGKVSPNSPAARAGIEAGDRIVSLAGRPTPTFGDLFNATAIRPGETVVVEVARGEQVRRVQVTLATDTMTGANGQKMERGVFGVSSAKSQLQPMPVTKAVPAAVNQTVRMTGALIDAVVQMIRGYVSPTQIGGPITIAKVAGDVATLGPLEFTALLAMLSINLGFINLLPVPMLDGGHLFFYTIEAVRRRPVSVEALDWAFRGGLALILGLLLFATGNDLGLWNKLERLIG
jgi:regulator of sigma E protease